MKILLAGGGSGGHVTPLLAVTNELNRLQSNLAVRCVCDHKFAATTRQLMAEADLPVDVQTIWAGKWRRYNGVSWWRQLLDIQTSLLNLRDLLLIVIGYLESMVLMLTWRPDVVFTKGGFVCVPIGLAARTLGIPIVMHDSDAHPGLANRILARFARAIATGSPLDNYNYPAAISHYVGVPISDQFRPYDSAEKLTARADWDLPDAQRPLLVVTGGGLGARRINQAIVSTADQLINELGLSIVHITGQGDYNRVAALATKNAHYRLLPFVSDKMAELFGAADIVVTRAGATTMLELAAAHASVIVVPNPLLTGGHQLKNAAVYRKGEAALIVDETKLDDGDLYRAIEQLVKQPALRQRLASNLATFAKPDAAKTVAELIIGAAK